MIRDLFKFNVNESANPVRRLVGIALTIVLGILAVVLIIKFVGTGRISLVGLDSKQPHTVEIIKQTGGKEIAFEKDISSNFSKFLAAGSYEIRVSSEDKQAITYLVTVPRFLGTTTKTVSLKNQSDRQKIARDVSSCPLLVGGQLYSYSCGWSNTITQHQGLTSTSYSARQNQPISGIIDARSYRDGILALRIASTTSGVSEAPILSFIKNGKVVANKSLPTSFADTLPDENPEYSLVVDTSSSERIVATKKTSYIEVANFDNFESKALTFKVEFGDTALDRLVSLVDLKGTQLLVAVGETANPNSHPQDDNKTSLSPAIFRVFDLKARSQESVEYRLDKPFTKAGLCGEEYICVLRDTSLLIYARSGNKLVLRGTVSQVDSFAALDVKSLAYIQEGKAYHLNLDDLSAVMLFSSNNFGATDIFATTEGLLLKTGLAGSPDSPSANVFILSLSAAASNNFADTKLPYTDDESVVDMDYAGKVILVTLLLNSATVDRATEKVNYDQTEYNQVTGALNARLAKDGFSAPEYTIRYLVSY